MGLFEVAWRRSGFGESDDELQFREKAVEALHRYHAREVASGSHPRWVERKFDFRIGPHHCGAGSTASITSPTGATS